MEALKMARERGSKRERVRYCKERARETEKDRE